MFTPLCFSRNRCTEVEQIDDQTIRSACRLQDTLTDAFVEIEVGLPDLEITNVKGEVRRSYKKECLNLSGSLIRGLTGESTDCKQLVFMVEECCHGVILAFTKDELLKSPRDKERVKEYYANMVKENIRLYNRCAAFAPGSSLVEGIKPHE